MAIEAANGIDLEVVGILSGDEGMAFGAATALVPPAVLPASASASYTLYAYQVPKPSSIARWQSFQA